MDDQSQTIEWLEDLPPDAAQRRETFARFGLATYQAQCVERQIGVLLATTLSPNFLRTPPEAREQFFEREFKKTLGQMLHTLRQRMDVSRETDQRLSKALTIRNWLVHEYFWERATQLLSRSGREKMIAELQEAADYLGEVDSELTSITQRWIAKLGITPEQIEQEFQKYRDSDET